MPIYEYECENKNCGIKIECLQKVTDEPIKICPECNNPSLKKLVSAAGFRLKGGGWYETDFKKDQTKKRNLSSNNADNSATTTSAADTNKSQDSGSKVDKSITTSSDSSTTKE